MGTSDSVHVTIGLGDENMRRLIGFLIGIGTGALVGATVAILLTPESGKDLRSELRSRMEGFRRERGNTTGTQLTKRAAQQSGSFYIQIFLLPKGIAISCSLAGETRGAHHHQGYVVYITTNIQGDVERIILWHVQNLHGGL